MLQLRATVFFLHETAYAYLQRQEKMWPNAQRRNRL